MVWGGAGSVSLGLGGEVGVDEWRAVFGSGGARHPGSGRAARALPAARDGTSRIPAQVGGRAGRDRPSGGHALDPRCRARRHDGVPGRGRSGAGREAGTGASANADGLTWAASRHATTRAGDPQVHDHILVANIVRMGDERGDWKGLDTGLLRDHLHAATAIGRMAAAAKAVELGYGIEADPGPSGRLGGWSIAGIPKEAWEVHATRAAEIEAAVGPDASYRSRGIAARATRDRKGHERIEDLVLGPQVAGRAGPGRVPAGRTCGRRGTVRPGLRAAQHEIVDQLEAQLLGPGGRLAAEKTFDVGDLVVAVAPLLHGLPVSMLDTAVEKVLSNERAIALPAVAGARQPVWAAACLNTRRPCLGL